MCENTTPIEKQVPCSHCGKICNPTDRWENGWPNYGFIKMGKDCCSLDYLWNQGMLGGGEEIDCGFFHPAMTEKNGYQHIEFEWSAEDGGGYRLCRDCQGKLMRIIGEFFKQDVAFQPLRKRFREKNKMISMVKEILPHIKADDTALFCLGQETNFPAGNDEEIRAQLTAFSEKLKAKWRQNENHRKSTEKEVNK